MRPKPRQGDVANRSAAGAPASHIAQLEAELQKLRHALERDDHELLERAMIDAQWELELCRERYVDLYDYAPIGYVTLDRNGFIREANLSATQMLGKPREKLLGSLLSRFVVRADRRKLLQHLTRCRRSSGQEQVNTELKVTGADGRQLNLEVASRMGPLACRLPGSMGFHTVLAEVRSRKRAEEDLRQLNERLEQRIVERTAELHQTVRTLREEAEARRAIQRQLRNSEERFRSLFEADPDAVFLIKARTGRIVEGNPSAQRLYGYSHEEICFLTLADLSGGTNAIEDLIRAESHVPLTISSHHTRSDGTVFPVEVTTCRVTATHGDFVCLIVRDTTEIQRAAQLTRAYQERLQSLVLDLSLAEARERRKMADDLHDTIGQLLALAKTRLILMAEKGRGGDLAGGIREVTQLLDRTHQICRSLVNELGNPALLDLGIGAAADKLAEEMGQLFGLKVHLEDDGQPKPMDPLRAMILLRCVREALVNTAKHAGVTEARVYLRRFSDRLSATVEDKGAGFDLARLGLDGAVAGFGLFSVRERIEGLGGSVEIQSAPNQGTTVRIEVPMAADAGELQEALP